MQLFECSHCQHPVYFDNTQCAHCQKRLGFDSKQMKMLGLSSTDQPEIYQAQDGQKYYKFCHNSQHHACNWLLDSQDEKKFCTACQLNRVIPDLSNPERLARWQTIERAKHRLVYSILSWKLPLVSKHHDEDYGLAFEFKADPEADDAPRVLTGHANGLITLNIAEADDVERAMARNNMDEVYRTVLGHFRHEIGHYYWDVLVWDSEFLEPCRALFGDERESYQDALDRHYHEGAPENWQDHYISAYATMHPWEDWAETWAHYLHIVDVLETVHSFGIGIHPQVIKEDQHLMVLNQIAQPYTDMEFEEIFQGWLAVSFAMNSLNRSMGHEDFYPFIINPSVKEKLEFIHRVIQHNTKNGTPTS